MQRGGRGACRGRRKKERAGGRVGFMGEMELRDKRERRWGRSFSKRNGEDWRCVKKRIY